MNLGQLLPSVRKEVEKPFQDKLEHAQKLVKMFAYKHACVSCSFGKDSTVVLWLCLRENPQIPVLYNNTGVEYSETLVFKEQLLRSWNLNLVETKPEKSFWQVMDEVLEKHEHLDDGKKHSNQCCEALKHKPTRQAIKEHGFLYAFTGITAVESRHRQFTACQKGSEYYVKKDGVTKIHPILYWLPNEVWQFIRDNHLPVNLAYEKYGLDRMGCVPCTSHKEWRKQVSKVNPAIYKLIQERYFHQRLLEVSS